MHLKSIKLTIAEQTDLLQVFERVRVDGMKISSPLSM